MRGKTAREDNRSRDGCEMNALCDKIKTWNVMAMSSSTEKRREVMMVTAK